MARVRRMREEQEAQAAGLQEAAASHGHAHGDRRSPGHGVLPGTAVNADHKSNIPLGEIWQSKGAKLCDDFHSRLEEEERIRSGFKAVSGYHTLDTASCPALSWLRMTNNKQHSLDVHCGIVPGAIGA